MSLNILDFNIFPDDDVPLRTFTYRDDATNAPLQPVMKKIGFFELRKTAPPRTRLAQWQEFLRTGRPTAAAPSYLQSAGKLIEYHNLSAKEKAMVDATQKAIDTAAAILEYKLDQAEARGEERGEARGMEIGQARGLEIGKVEGAREADIRTARKILDKGGSPEMAAELTDLTLQDVLELQQALDS